MKLLVSVCIIKYITRSELLAGYWAQQNSLSQYRAEFDAVAISYMVGLDIYDMMNVGKGPVSSGPIIID